MLIARRSSMSTSPDRHALCVGAERSAAMRFMFLVIAGFVALLALADHTMNHGRYTDAVVRHLNF
jgi:hypothetical protein